MNKKDIVKIKIEPTVHAPSCKSCTRFITQPGIIWCEHARFSHKYDQDTKGKWKKELDKVVEKYSKDCCDYVSNILNPNMKPSRPNNSEKAKKIIQKVEGGVCKVFGKEGRIEKDIKTFLEILVEEILSELK